MLLSQVHLLILFSSQLPSQQLQSCLISALETIILVLVGKGTISVCVCLGRAEEQEDRDERSTRTLHGDLGQERRTYFSVLGNSGHGSIPS
jgi:hypothetical protein